MNGRLIEIIDCGVLPAELNWTEALWIFLGD
jgi:hypothetical protein